MEFTQIKQDILYNRYSEFDPITDSMLGVVHQNKDEYEKLGTINEFSEIERRIMPHLTRKTVEWKSDLNIDLYWSLYNIGTSEMLKLQTIQYLLHKHSLSDENRVVLERYCVELLENLDTTYEIKSNIADILIRYGSNAMREFGNMHIEILGFENRHVGNGYRPKHAQHSVYEDKQNVHHTSVNESVLDIVSNLIKDSYTNSNLFRDIESKLIPSTFFRTLLFRKSITEISIQTSLKRIECDTSEFRGAVKLKHVLEKVWGRILSKPIDIQKELCTRLSQELVEMNGLCATGNLSRLINVLSGFDEIAQIKMDCDTELYASLSARLYKLIEQLPDEELKGDIVIGMSENASVNYQKYMTFKNSVRESLYTELLAEYKPLLQGSERKFAEIFERQFSRLV